MQLDFNTNKDIPATTLGESSKVCFWIIYLACNSGMYLHAMKSDLCLKDSCVPNPDLIAGHRCVCVCELICTFSFTTLDSNGLSDIFGIGSQLR